MHQQLTQQIEDLLSHLEAETYHPAKNSNNPLCHVPSTVTVSGVCPRGLPRDELQRAVRVSLGQKRQMMNTTLCLLSLSTIRPPSLPGITSNMSLLTSEDSWTLNTLTRFWEAIAPAAAQLDYTGSNLSSIVSFLDRIRVYLAHILGLNPLSAVVNRMSILFSQIITTFVAPEPLPLPSSVEKRLCLMAIDLALIDSKSEPRFQSLVWDSLSALLEVRQDHKRFDVLGQDLQVRATRYYSLTTAEFSKFTGHHNLFELPP